MKLIKAVERLQSLNGKMRDLKFSGDEIKSAIENDLKSANSISAKIRALRNMITASRRIAEIMGVRSKAGQKAAQIQSIKINSMILEELQAMHRSQFLAYLEEREVNAKRDLYLREIVTKEKK